MTKRAGSTWSNTGGVVQKDTGLRRGVVGGDWRFDATIGLVKGGVTHAPEESSVVVRFTFHTVEEPPIDLISQFVDMVPNIVAISHGHFMWSTMVAVQPFLVAFQPLILSCFDLGSTFGLSIFKDVTVLC